MPVRELPRRLLKFVGAGARYEPSRRVVVATLAGLVAVQWVVVALAARATSHEGWLFGWRVYQGGDDTWYYTTAWTLSQGRLPFAEIGHGWPILLAPLTAVTGPNLLDGLAPIVLLQVVVLVPIGVLCVYGIARGIGGFALGVWAAVVWIGLPVVAVQYFDGRYRDVYVDQLLPQFLGLVPQGDFVSMIALVVAAYFIFRAAEGGDTIDALAAGLAVGVALAVKPANVLFVPAVVAFVAVRPAPRVAMWIGAAAALPALTSLV